MSFVSYAQNFEDVMLWRALKHVENGTYVDVGAQHPVADSVSKAFYLHGWRGVHIEPVPYYAQLLRQDRPDETVLQVALGEAEGVLALNVIPETGLSTAVDEYARAHHEHGFATQQVHVPMLTLKSALAMLAGRELHWLKVDVEGFEEQVLKGWDSTTLRPWVMVIEATIPGSSETDYARWDPIVQEAGYRFVYFDGLNRFYVANEHPELVAAFAVPPNVFDDVRLSGYASWGLYREVESRQQALLSEAEAAAEASRQALQASHAAFQHLLAERDQARDRFEAASAALNERIADLRHENQDAERQIAEMRATTHEWWSMADRLSHELKAMHASTSWRITAPLRRVSTVARRFPSLPRRVIGWSKRHMRQVGRPVLVWSMRKVLAHTGLRNAGFRIANRHPGLKHYLRGFAGRAGLIDIPVSTPAPVAFQDTVVVPGTELRHDLPPRTARIYRQLKKQSDRKEY